MVPAIHGLRHQDAITREGHRNDGKFKRAGSTYGPVQFPLNGRGFPDHQGDGFFRLPVQLGSPVRPLLHGDAAAGSQQYDRGKQLRYFQRKGHDSITPVRIS
jgi:hypothetical protein